MYRIYLNQWQGPLNLGVTSFDSFYDLPLMKSFVTDFSETMKAVKLKLGKHGQWADVSYIPESGPRAYSCWSYIP